MKRWLQNLASQFGVQVVKTQWLRESLETRWSMRNVLHRLKILGCGPSVIIDIGAASGDWAEIAADVFPDSKFILVEPLLERRRLLEDFCKKHPGSWAVSSVAGAEDGEVTFDVADDLDGSGVYARSDGTGRKVPMNRLDSVVAEGDVRGPFLIKLDTHGYESEILSGARRILDDTVCIVMECYTFQISPSSKLFWEMCKEMDQLGFRVADMADPWPRKHDRLLWQMDLVWLRKDHSAFGHESYQ